MTIEVAAHGIEAIEAIDKVAERVIGFRSPSGEWTIGVSAIKGAFLTSDWRENKELIALYKEAGGTTPIKALTRRPPNDVVALLLEKRLRTAMYKGQRIYITKAGEA